jgi:hypothetical protein
MKHLRLSQGNQLIMIGFCHYTMLFSLLSQSLHWGYLTKMCLKGCVCRYLNVKMFEKKITVFSEYYKIGKISGMDPNYTMNIFSVSCSSLLLLFLIRVDNVLHPSLLKEIYVDIYILVVRVHR